MSKKLDWRKASLDPKQKLSVADEKEYRGNDAAARWLDRHLCPHCDSVLSAVTWTCVRGKHCPGEKGKRK